MTTPDHSRKNSFHAHSGTGKQSVQNVNNNWIQAWRSAWSLGILLALPLYLSSVHGGEIQRTQVISLTKGWNSVFLEVQPEDLDPAEAFSGVPVDIVASHYNPNQPTQFVSDPAADLFRETGWNVWYAPERPDAFLTTLFAIYGPRAYLIHARSNFAWEVEGAVVLEPIQWQPDSFNLVGYSLNEQAPPTFAQFFAGSSAHQHNRIYRLMDEHWTRIQDPTAEIMRSGEAFWVYCDGTSGYQGPLDVSTTLQAGLVLTDRPDKLVLRNRTDHPLTPTIEHVPTGNAPVPISVVIQTTDPDQLTGISSMIKYVSVPQPTGSWTLPLPVIEAGKGISVPMEARLEEMTTYLHSSLFKITTDLGTEQWVPVFALRQDLKQE